VSLKSVHITVNEGYVNNTRGNYKILYAINYSTLVKVNVTTSDNSTVLKITSFIQK